tara:strand:- start:86 stop:337 length:252 start_codon:yes stop_codon:yes gene_type:complete
MRNYPDDCPSWSFGEEDMDGVEKLSCGCYEEACECSWCEHCGEKYGEDEGNSSVLALCEDCAECKQCGEWYEASAKCCEERVA